MEKRYYEKYWKGDLGDKGLFMEPPREEISKNLESMKKYIKGSVLDYGCGQGNLLRIMSEINSEATLHGFDISSNAIKLAKERNHDLEINFHAGESLVDVFTQGQFDFVTATDVMEHIIDVDGTLKDINRLLKVGGHLYITTVDFNFLKKILISMFAFDKYFYPTTPHIRFFTRKTLEDLLITRGFKPIRYEWDGSYWGLMPKGQIIIAEKIRTENA